MRRPPKVHDSHDTDDRLTAEFDYKVSRVRFLN